MDEVCCATAAVHAGLHCNLLAQSTSVATVQRSALVQILERFAMQPKKRSADGPLEDSSIGVSWNFSCRKIFLVQEPRPKVAKEARPGMQ